MHINRDLHALRFALIFFFCSENLRLFFNQLWFIKIRWARSSLFVYSQETSSASSAAADVYTGTVYYMQSQSVRYIDILCTLASSKLKSRPLSIYLSSVWILIHQIEFFDNLLRAKINIRSIQFVQNVFFEDILYISLSPFSQTFFLLLNVT